MTVAPSRVRRHSGVLAGLLVLLSLAGCGGGSGEGSGSGSGRPSGQDRLRSIVLMPADVGPGYADDPNVAAAFNKAIGEALARCGRGDTFLSGTNQADRAESSLRRDGLTGAYSMAVSAPSEAEARAVMDLIGSDAFPGCLSKALEEQAGDPTDGIFVAEMTTTRSAVISGVDRTVSLQNKTVLTFRQPGVSVTAFTDYVFLQEGRKVAKVAILAKDPTPRVELQRLVELVADRLER